MGDGEGRVEATGAVASVTNVCEIPTEDFLAGPGGYTSREFEGEWYVSEDQYLYTSDFAYCAVHRLDLALAEAERRGIDRTIMERAVDHTALDPDDCPQSSPTSSSEKSGSGGAGVDLDRLAKLAEAAMTPNIEGWDTEPWYLAETLCDEDDFRPWDAAFIAAADPQTVLALVKRVSVLEASLALIVPVLDESRSYVVSLAMTADINTAIRQGRAALAAAAGGPDER